MKERPSGEKKLQFRFEQDAKEPVALTAYTFDRKDNLVGETEVRDGILELSTDTARRGHRTFVTRTPDKGTGGKPTAASLRRIGAYEVSRNLGLREITKAIWIPPRICICIVKGRVVKPVTHPNGETVDYPVCNVKVHVCEVDSIFDVIYRVPDLEIERLRERLIEVDLGRPFPPFPEPQPGPDPAPEFRFDTRVVDVTPENVARMVRKNSLQAQLDSLDVALNFGAPAPAGIQQTQLSTQEEPAAQGGGALPQDLRLALHARTSTNALRNTLALHADLLRAIFCPPSWWFRCDEIDTVTTDENGEFSLFMVYPCGDTPDLYFSVEYNGEFVYRPRIGCGTRWNYRCGTEVTIRVTDPRVPWCDPGTQLPGDQLVVLTIGNNVNVAQIATSGTNRGLAPGVRPFGGSLEPHVWFGTGLAAKGITHYRWSYRKGGVGPFLNITEPVIRHYAVDTGTNVTFVADPQGPVAAPAGSLFRIQSQVPPSVPGAVTSWAPQVDARENTATAFWKTHVLDGTDPFSAAGLYELRLELFRNDGSRVDNWAAEGITGRIPDPSLSAPFGAGDVTTIVAPAPNLYLEGGNIAGMRFDIHVDNNPCEAVIHAPAVTNMIADANCGFYEYEPPPSAPTVELKFRAWHPFDWADFSFNVHRGPSVPVTAANAAGRVGSPASPYAIDAITDDYEHTFAVTELLGTCPKAAFALTLQVDARATDGWSILTYLSATGVPKAIAFAPQ